MGELGQGSFKSSAVPVLVQTSGIAAGGGQPGGSPAPPSPSPGQSPAPEETSSSSTNVGAIVGGVVGGLAGEESRGGEMGNGLKGWGGGTAYCRSFCCRRTARRSPQTAQL